MEIELNTIQKTEFEQSGTSIPFLDIHKNFTTTSFGENLANNIRYERFKPSHITKERWVELLGEDVNNLTHLTFTFALTQNFIEECICENNSPSEDSKSPLFTQDDIQKLLLTAIVHDWGESIIGDISFELKTDEDEQKELKAFDVIFNEINVLSSTNYLDPSLIKSTLKEVLFDKETKLAKTFNAVERLGYLTTALRAWEVSQNFQFTDPTLAQSLEHLTANVFLNQIPDLVKYAEEYPAIDKYLKANTNTITKAFLTMPYTSFEITSPDQLWKRVGQFNSSREAWFSWIGNGILEN